MTPESAAIYNAVTTEVLTSSDARECIDFVLKMTAALPKVDAQHKQEAMERFTSCLWMLVNVGYSLHIREELKRPTAAEEARRLFNRLRVQYHD